MHKAGGQKIFCSSGLNICAENDNAASKYKTFHIE